MSSRNAEKKHRDVAVQTDKVGSDEDGTSAETSDDESLLDEHDLLAQYGSEDTHNIVSPTGVALGFRRLVDRIGESSAEKFLDLAKSQKVFQWLQGRQLKLDITGKGQKYPLYTQHRQQYSKPMYNTYLDSIKQLRGIRVRIKHLRAVCPDFTDSYQDSRVRCRANNRPVNLYQLNAGKPKIAIVRMDVSHANVPYNHLNINPKVSGLPTDPHLRLPSGAMPVGRGAARAAKALNRANKVLLPIAVAVDVARTGYAVSQDIKNKTSRNTVETAASIAGGWAGGFGGATAGAAVGSLILPGIGTIAGGLIGAFSGGLACAAGSTALVNHIGDACDYDTIRKLCATCRCLFYIRVYDGESRDWKYCVDCRKPTDQATQCPDTKDDNSEANDDEDYDKVHDRVD